MFMNSSSSKILSYFFPSVCLACHHVFEFGDERQFCETCDKEVLNLGENICTICGDSFSNQEIESHVCGECLKNPPAFEWARSVFKLTPQLSKMIYALKYSNDETALPWMAAEMKIFLNTKYPDFRPDLLMPIPLHRSRLIKRGYNQSLLLARRISKLEGIELSYNNLQKTISTKAQSTLSRASRLKQLKGAFELDKPLNVKDKKILLIDDVYTTGATLQEAARVLKQAGAKVYAFSLARTLLTSPQFK